ncbi:MAG: drug resistance transporter, EmrB/QacA subfamily [Conexibacter sp.]|nr:drug resistance transporter, EmrB/QacA subfamily [Conexibacter sp.]
MASTPTAAPTRDRRSVALAALCTGTLMVALDATVVNVALPVIQDDLVVSASDLAWVINAYLIAFGGLLLLAGRIGDLVGRRTCFLAGMAVFTLASLGCGLAHDEQALVAFRFVQGTGGALVAAVALGMVVSLFPEPREQARALGIFAFVASAGGAIGLLAGGIVTQLLDWHWIFLINLPVGVLTSALTARVVDRDAGVGLGAGLDLIGGLLITSALMLAVYAIVGPAATLGWGAERTLLVAALAGLLLAAFVGRQATAPTPLLDLRLLTVPNVAAANLVQLLSVAGMFGLFFLGTLYLQRVLGYDALRIGLAFVPVTVALALSSIVWSAPMIQRYGERKTVLLGLSLMAAGLVLFAQAPVDGGFVVNVLPVTVLLGVGAGLSLPALMGLAMAGATATDAGVISGLVGTTAQVGGALGLAVLATLSTSRTATLQAGGVSPGAALVAGYHLAFWVAAGLVVVAIGLAASALHPAVASSADALEPRPPSVHVCGATFVVAGPSARRHDDSASGAILDGLVRRRDVVEREAG